MKNFKKKNYDRIGWDIPLACLLMLALALGCTKEKIVESTEYIEKTEFIELPPDTVLLVDSIIIYDTTTTNTVDTVVQTITVTDTVVQTVYQDVYIYDTTLLIDTVLQAQCTPNEHLAFTALQYYTDPEVLSFIYDEFGIADGWVLYLSPFQSEKSASGNTYIFFGVIDYWTPDWSQYYALEFYWQMVYTGGDPADPTNWRMEDPPAAPNSNNPGLTRVIKGPSAN